MRLYIFFILCFIIASCSEFINTNDSSTNNHLLVDVSDFYHLSDNDSLTFSISASDEWSLTTDVPWLIISTPNGNACELDSITVILEKNESEDFRKGYIIITMNDIEKRILVVQTGISPLLHICEHDLTTNADSIELIIKIVTNLSWNIEIPESCSWIQCDSLNGSAGADLKIPIKTTFNLSEKMRETTLLIHAGTCLDSIHIYQNGLTPQLETNTDSIVVAADSSNAFFFLKTNQAWNITYEPCSWFSIDSISSDKSADSLLIRLSFIPNENHEIINESVITLHSGSLSKDIAIKQCAAMNREGIDITNTTPDLSVEYDWNKTILTLCLPDHTNTSDINIYIPYLKYNKQSVFSFTLDDTPNGAYSKIWSRINKKWIDDEKYFHIEQVQSTGYTPEKALSMTDGCGIEKRIPIGVAIWPNKSNQWISNYMNPSSAGKYYPYLTWSEAQSIVDFGGDVYFHNVDENIYNKANVESIQSGFAADNATTYEHLGRYMKVLMRPDGNLNYTMAALTSNNIVVVCDETDGWKAASFYYPTTNDLSLYHTKWFRYIYSESKTVDGHIANIQTNHESSNPFWYHFFIHTPGEDTMDILPRMEALWGQSGNNSMWFATVDELYEYSELRKYLRITKTIESNKIILTFENLSPHILPIAAEWHRDFSLMIEGLSANDALSVQSSNNIYGVSYAAQDNSKWLLNVNCNRTVIDLVEKYVTIYENLRTNEAREDAVYFIQQLKPEFQTEYLERIE